MPGARDELQAAFSAVHGPQEPEHRAPADPGAAALDGVLAFRGEDTWHLVSLGAGGRLPGAPRVELTLLTPPAERPPGWAFALLAGVAATCLAAGRPLHAGARLAPGPPLDGAASGLVALGVREDPVVMPPAGITLLQLVGITGGEHALMGRVGTAVVLGKLAERDPLLRTDPARAPGA